MPETRVRFQAAVLGSGVLLPGFERELCGMRPLRWKEFHVDFPPDYFHPGIAGKTLRFQAYLHHVLKPVHLEGWDELAGRAPRNIYRIQDIPSLQEHNENLYYLVLRETSLSALTRESMTDYLNLMGMYARLGFAERALDMAAHLPADPGLAVHVARIFRASSLAERALDVLERTGEATQELALQKALCLFDLGRLDEAEDVATRISSPGDEEALELKVKLAARLAMPLEEYLRREEDLLDCRLRKVMGGLVGRPGLLVHHGTGVAA